MACQNALSGYDERLSWPSGFKKFEDHTAETERSGQKLSYRKFGNRRRGQLRAASRLSVHQPGAWTPSNMGYKDNAGTKS